MNRYVWMLAAWWVCMVCNAQTYALERVNDSLTYLTLTTGRYTDRVAIHKPVFRLETGDVDGDGREEAIVGIIGRTRHDPRYLKRLHIYKNVGGRVRPMWMGSQLGGILEDFRFINGQIHTLQSTTDGRYVEMTHRWRKFGLGSDSIIQVRDEQFNNSIPNNL